MNESGQTLARQRDDYKRPRTDDSDRRRPVDTLVEEEWLVETLQSLTAESEALWMRVTALTASMMRAGELMTALSNTFTQTTMQMADTNDRALDMSKRIVQLKTAFFH